MSANWFSNLDLIMNQYYYTVITTTFLWQFSPGKGVCSLEDEVVLNTTNSRLFNVGLSDNGISSHFLSILGENNHGLSYSSAENTLVITLSLAKIHIATAQLMTLTLATTGASSLELTVIYRNGTQKQGSVSFSKYPNV